MSLPKFIYPVLRASHKAGAQVRREPGPCLGSQLSTFKPGGLCPDPSEMGEASI